MHVSPDLIREPSVQARSIGEMQGNSHSNEFRFISLDATNCPFKQARESESGRKLELLQRNVHDCPDGIVFPSRQVPGAEGDNEHGSGTH